MFFINERKCRGLTSIPAKIAPFILSFLFAATALDSTFAQPGLDGCQLLEAEALGPEATVGGDSDSDGDGVRGAQDYCPISLSGGFQIGPHGCPTEFDPYHGLVFDHAKHEAWYRRFWTGRCEGFGFLDFCVEDDGGWPAVIASTLTRLPEDHRQLMRAQMWGIGRLIGFEWAKDNDIREIHTSDLRRWRSLLDATSDPRRALERICFEARAALGRE